MEIRINRQALYQYLWIYIVIQFIGGRLATALGSDLFMGGILILAAIHIVLHKSLLETESLMIGVLIGMMVLMCSTIFLTSGGLSLASSLSVIVRFLAVMVAMTIDRERFLHRFLKMVFVFSCISLILFVFVQIVGESVAIGTLFSKLYEIRNGSSWLGNSYGLFLICYNFMDASRNAYMFGEPGEYQMLIMLALYFLVFKEKEMDEKTKKKYLMVFLITMLTIQSTTGFFSLVVFVVCVLLSNAKIIHKNIKRVILLLTLLACTYLMFFAGENGILYTAVLNKITNASGNLDLGATTGGDRVASILAFTRIVATVPTSLIFGVGYRGVVQYIGQFSCSGIVNSIIMFGIFTCTLMYGYMIRNIVKYSSNGFEIIFVLFMVINNGLSQPDLLAITGVIASCYGVLVQRYLKTIEQGERI